MAIPLKVHRFYYKTNLYNGIYICILTVYRKHSDSPFKFCLFSIIKMYADHFVYKQKLFHTFLYYYSFNTF